MAIHNLRDGSIEVSVSAMRHHQRALRKQRLWSTFSFKNGFGIFIKDTFRVQHDKHGSRGSDEVTQVRKIWLD